MYLSGAWLIWTRGVSKLLPRARTYRGRGLFGRGEYLSCCRERVPIGGVAYWTRGVCKLLPRARTYQGRGLLDEGRM